MKLYEIYTYAYKEEEEENDMNFDFMKMSWSKRYVGVESLGNYFMLKFVHIYSIDKIIICE